MQEEQAEKERLQEEKDKQKEAVSTKKKKDKSVELDDLLNAGLAASKKKK